MPDFGYDFGPGHTDTYRVVRCAACRHAYCSPLPENLYANYAGVRDEAYLKNRPQRIDTAARVIQLIRRYKPGGRLLDVGCATGDFLTVAGGHFQVEGLELSDWAAEIAQRSGFLTHRSRLSELAGSDLYDVVTLWGVIEHFEDPVLEVREIRRLLRPGGIVCLWTGDLDSWLARALGRRWWYFQGQHIQYFSRRSIDKLFAQQGFRPLAMRTYPYVMSMRSLAKSLGRYRMLGALAKTLLDNARIGAWKITFRLPGEMFAIYAKV